MQLERSRPSDRRVKLLRHTVRSAPGNQSRKDERGEPHVQSYPDRFGRCWRGGVCGNEVPTSTIAVDLYSSLKVRDRVSSDQSPTLC